VCGPGLQQKRHDYYEENKDRIKEYAKYWKQDNPLTAWVQKQEYFEKNRKRTKIKSMNTDAVSMLGKK
jgi:hypothetical protein